METLPCVSCQKKVDSHESKVWLENGKDKGCLVVSVG